MASMLSSPSRLFSARTPNKGCSRGEEFVAVETISIRRNRAYPMNFQCIDLIDGRLKNSKVVKPCRAFFGNTEPHEYTLPMKIPSAKVFIAFIRLFAIIGVVLGVVSGALIAVETISDISLRLLTEVIKVAVIFACLQVYSNGINNIYDFEIDKISKPYVPLSSGEMDIRTAVAITFGFAIMISKPYVPLSSGEMDIRTAVAITFGFAIMAFTFAFGVGSWPLVWGSYIYFLNYSAYSINFPFLRWKKREITAALSTLVNLGIIIPTTTFLHVQTFVLRRQASITRTLILQVVFLSFFTVALALFKDIPDVEGDSKHGVRSLAARLGQTKVFWICVYIIEAIFICAAVATAAYSHSWRKPITTFSQIVLALILWRKAKAMDLKNKDSIMPFFWFLWKLLYAEYLILPLVR